MQQTEGSHYGTRPPNQAQKNALIGMANGRRARIESVGGGSEHVKHL